jgi:hypothetical protein
VRSCSPDHAEAAAAAGAAAPAYAKSRARLLLRKRSAYLRPPPPTACTELRGRTLTLSTFSHAPAPQLVPGRPPSPTEGH